MQYRHLKLIIFMLLFLFSLNIGIGYALPNFKKNSDIADLKLKYNFRFWMTSNAAYATLTVKKTGKNKFVISLIGETTGVVGFFASYRKDVMKSECKFDEKLKRFIPLKFIKKIIIGKNIKKSIYIFDYTHMKIFKNKTKIIFEDIEDSDDPFAIRRIEKHSQDIIPLKKKIVDDYLTASLNFFTGVYGFPKKGETVKIYLFPESNKKKRNRNIKVTFLGKKQLLYKIFIDLNVDFISDNIKKAYGLIDSEMIPVKITIPTGTVLGTIKVERIEIKNGEK